MGIMLCEKHGRSGIAAVCSHIRDNVFQGVKVSLYYKIETQFEDGMHLLSWLICPTCLEELRQLGLPESGVLQGDDDFLNTWQNILEERGFMKSVVCSSMQ